MGIASRDINLNSWHFAIVKILILLILPYYLFWGPVGYSMPHTNYSFVYECILFRALSNTIPEGDSSSIAHPSTVIAAVILCLPGLFFSKWLATRSRREPVLHIAFAVAFFIGLLMQSFLIYPIPEEWVDVIVFPWELQRFILLVFIFLIIIPLFAREASIQRYINGQSQDIKSTKISNLTGSSTTHNSSHINSRFIMALCLAIILMPVSLSIYSDISSEQTYINIMAPIFNLSGTLSEYEHSLAFNLSDLTNPYYANTFSILQFFFGLTILWYYQGKLPKRHVSFYSIIGILFPTIITSMSLPYYGSDWFNLWMPIPAFYIIGYLVVNKIDRGEIIEIAEVIGPSRERTKIIPEVAPIVHKPDVEIPLWYILLSKIRTKLHALSQRQPRSNPDPED